MTSKIETLLQQRKRGLMTYFELLGALFAHVTIAPDDTGFLIGRLEASEEEELLKLSIEIKRLLAARQEREN